MAMMRRCSPLLPSFAFASILMSGIAPVAEASSSDDAQIRALKAEMAEMRREMMGQITHLKSQIAQNETRQRGPASRRATRTTAQNGYKFPEKYADNDVDPNVKFGEQTPRKNILLNNGVGTPPSDRGMTTSWKDFKAATQKDENVHVGGMIIGFPKGRFTVASEDGAYGLSIGLAFHEDFGGFMGMSPRRGETKGDFSSFTENARRLRIPFTFRYKDWVANITPDFGSGSADGSDGLYEANLNYTGLHNTILTVGYFQPRVTEEDSESSNDFEMMERPAITDIVRNIAAGDARFSVGGLHYEKRWWIAGYFTGQTFGNRAKDTNIGDSQTGGTFRVAGRPYVSKDIDVHLGLSAISAFKVNDGTNGRTYTFKEAPEVNLTTTALLNTGALRNIGSVWSAGPELGFRWKKLVLKGEYYHIGVTRNQQQGGQSLPSLSFEGYYGAANYTLFGKPRMYNEKEGAFSAPGVEHEFDPAHGYWGALELSGRYSVADFDDTANSVRGGRQTVWSGGVNWYPNRHFRVMLDFNHFIVTRNSQAYNILGRDGNSVAARVQAAF
ncbi:MULTISPECIES: OprO/OprP family phosphate-selective porin [Acetobacter]|uniref:Porin n=4 Tax=Acetobacter TaxID=434 RepID=A0AAN1PJB1_9PROT|nr:MULTISPECIES: porin [Acetobacter]ANA12869.1 porin [Acetobacter oryzifermentans]ASL39266.1 porin [Acetobacter oryzifermentans]AXN01391.1 porin [Acetobacter pomorum]KAA8384903.1 porin [Acetobacter sp. DmW_136]KAA8394948.1 porin [Acetobacter sp. DmW_125124]